MSLLDDEDILSSPVRDIGIILEFINHHYVIHGYKSAYDAYRDRTVRIRQDNGCVVDVDGHVISNKFMKEAEYLTNGLFRFGSVKSFDVDRCKNLKSLEGGPEQITGSYMCRQCDSLKNLKGAPKYVDRGFWCDHCKNLESLEGSPSTITDIFSCSYCNKIKDLKGAPEFVGRLFMCNGCESLESVNHFPRTLSYAMINISGCPKIKRIPKRLLKYDISYIDCSTELNEYIHKNRSSF